MYVLGHIGAALLVYAPVAFVLSWYGEPMLAGMGLAIAAGLAALPDADEHLPIPHRGPTHTVWFVFAGGLAVAAGGWLLGQPSGEAWLYAAVFGTSATLSLLSHLLADSITPMGIRPFVPLSEFDHSFELVYSKNRQANLALFSIGVVSVLLTQGFVILR